MTSVGKVQRVTPVLCLAALDEHRDTTTKTWGSAEPTLEELQLPTVLSVNVDSLKSLKTATQEATQQFPTTQYYYPGHFPRQCAVS